MNHICSIDLIVLDHSQHLPAKGTVELPCTATRRQLRRQQIGVQQQRGGFGAGCLLLRSGVVNPCAAALAPEPRRIGGCGSSVARCLRRLIPAPLLLRNGMTEAAELMPLIQAINHPPLLLQIINSLTCRLRPSIIFFHD